MRQEHETEKIFNQLKEITQIMQAQKTPTPKSENANISDLTQKTGLKPKAMLQTKKGRLNPTKKAFSMRQKTTLKKGLQESETLKNGTQANANAFKTEQANNSSLRAKPSDQAFKPGLRHTPRKRGQQ
ncbi:hypothetical protein KVK00_01620 [Helicobacter pylori]|nr:hypothetical protein KVK00_01620 [Helicobacter pylori]